MFDLITHVVTLLIIALVLFFAWRAIKRAESNRVPLRVPLDLRELEAADTRALEAARVATPRLAARGRGAALAPAADAGDRRRDHRSHRTPARRSRADLRSWLADRRT